MFPIQLTVDLESIVNPGISGTLLVEHGAHVEKIIEGHVPAGITGENLANPLFQWVLLVPIS